MAKADPLYSAGARFERKALREYLERKLKAGLPLTAESVLSWVRAREQRYAKRLGGL